MKLINLSEGIINNYAYLAPRGHGVIISQGRNFDQGKDQSYNFGIINNKGSFDVDGGIFTNAGTIINQAAAVGGYGA